MRHFIALFLALAGCVTDEITDNVALTDSATVTPEDAGELECPPVPPTPPPHLDGDVIVAEPEEAISDRDWLEALSPGHGQSIRATD